jgi:hypothetical protein
MTQSWPPSGIVVVLPQNEAPINVTTYVCMMYMRYIMPTTHMHNMFNMCMQHTKHPHLVEHAGVRLGKTLDDKGAKISQHDCHFSHVTNLLRTKACEDIVTECKGALTLMYVYVYFINIIIHVHIYTTFMCTHIH